MTQRLLIDFDNLVADELGVLHELVVVVHVEVSNKERPNNRCI
jgi:hypothetical protein